MVSSRSSRWASALAAALLATSLSLPAAAVDEADAAPDDAPAVGELGSAGAIGADGAGTAGDEPSGAAGAEVTDGPVDTPTDAPSADATVASSEDATDGDDRPDERAAAGTDDRDDEADAPATAPTADGAELASGAGLTDGLCPTPLVAFTPASIRGDERAVALTSTAYEQGIDGWTHVSWEAAADIAITAVAVRHGDDVEHLTEGNLRRGTVLDVTAIAFCGEHDPERASSEDDDVEVLGVQIERPASDDTGGDDTDDTEVLGVQLARTGTSTVGLAAAGLVALLGGATVLVRTSRRRTTEVGR